MTETRHSHGTIQHDHEGGDVPHEHKLGDPVLTNSHGWFDNWMDREEQKLASGQQRSSHGGSAAFSFGTIFIVLGALGFFVTSNNHSACQSVLVQAVNQSQCSEVNGIWTLGVLGLVVGIALLIVGAILRSKS